MGAGLLFLGLFLAALVAVMAVGCGADGGGGKTKVDGAADHSENASPADPIAFETSSREPLRPPMPFPDVRLRSIDGERTQSAALVRGQYSIVIFVKVGCEACTEVLEVWEKVLHEFPPEMNVFGVTREDPVLAREYVEESGFPFSLYCDEEGVFETRYGIGKYPSMVGVVTDGTVAYVGKPVTPEFTPQKAWALLVRVVRARAEGTAEPDSEIAVGNEEAP